VITALYITQKIDELYPKKIINFAYYTNNGYTVDEIRKMEIRMVKVSYDSLLLMFI
jgi:hypothetical protein